MDKSNRRIPNHDKVSMETDFPNHNMFGVALETTGHISGKYTDSGTEISITFKDHGGTNWDVAVSGGSPACCLIPEDGPEAVKLTLRGGAEYEGMLEALMWLVEKLRSHYDLNANHAPFPEKTAYQIDFEESCANLTRPLGPGELPQPGTPMPGTVVPSNVTQQ